MVGGAGLEHSARVTMDPSHDGATPAHVPDPRAAGVPRDAIYYRQLARQARRMASAHGDADVARRLRETAVKHDATARQLQREEDRAAGRVGIVSRIRQGLRRLSGR